MTRTHVTAEQKIVADGGDTLGSTSTSSRDRLGYVAPETAQTKISFATGVTTAAKPSIQKSTSTVDFVKQWRFNAVAEKLASKGQAAMRVTSTKKIAAQAFGNPFAVSTHTHLYPTRIHLSMRVVTYRRVPSAVSARGCLRRIPAGCSRVTMIKTTLAGPFHPNYSIA